MSMRLDLSQLVAMWCMFFQSLVSLAASAKIGRMSAVKPYLTLACAFWSIYSRYGRGENGQQYLNASLRRVRGRGGGSNENMGRMLNFLKLLSFSYLCDLGVDKKKKNSCFVVLLLYTLA